MSNNNCCNYANGQLVANAHHHSVVSISFSAFPISSFLAAQWHFSADHTCREDDDEEYSHELMMAKKYHHQWPWASFLCRHWEMRSRQQVVLAGNGNWLCLRWGRSWAWSTWTVMHLKEHTGLLNLLFYYLLMFEFPCSRRVSRAVEIMRRQYYC